MFTETLIKFLNDNEQSELWQEIVGKFNMFPKFNIELDDNESYEFNMYSMFKDEYGMREIGQEDEQHFYFEVKRQLNKSLIEFNPKINAFIDKWNTLLSRKETLSSNESREYDNASTGTNEQFLNPINSSAYKTTDKESVSTTDSGSDSKEKTYDVIYSLVGKSNVDLLNDLLKLKNIYLSCLESFNVLFMLVY